MSDNIDSLRNQMHGPVFLSGDDGIAEELAGFNSSVVHSPEVVAGVASADDAVSAVRFANTNRLRIAVQSTGHGPDIPIKRGMMVTTKRLDEVEIDPENKVATVGSGARWKSVIAESSRYGLVPISGSSPGVGTAGLLLGGGIGPLVRSHGASSDYLAEATLVTGDGETETVSNDHLPDLYWAIRGGKHGLGLVTELKIRLVEMETLYAGGMMFSEENIESVLRCWINWTDSADSRITTSVMMLHIPPVPIFPEHLRGKRILHLRFAFPGSAAEGEKLAEPLRACAPALFDGISLMSATEIGRIHNEPDGPLPSRHGGYLLTHIDQKLATILLDRVGKDTNPPVLGVEVRHIGGAFHDDVTEGSAVGGRAANFVLSYVAVNPGLFETSLPRFTEDLFAAAQPWKSTESNFNFAGTPQSRASYESCWSPSTFSRLENIRNKYDRGGLFAYEL